METTYIVKNETKLLNPNKHIPLYRASMTEMPALELYINVCTFAVLSALRCSIWYSSVMSR